MAWRRITDKQWKAIEPHLPKRKRSRKGGRPPANDRKCFEGILWILWTGAPWSDEQSENQLPKDNRYAGKYIPQIEKVEHAKQAGRVWRPLLAQHSPRTPRVLRNWKGLFNLIPIHFPGFDNSVKPTFL